MFMGLLLAATANAATPAPPVTGALASVGEVLGTTRVARVETHPEYERYWLRQPDGADAVAEMVTGEGGLCDVGGLTIFPRPELGGAPGTVGMDALCARMAERHPTLRARIGEGGPEASTETAAPDGGGAPDGVPASPGPVDAHAPLRWSALHAVIAAIVLLGVSRARIDRTLAAVGLTALVARLLLSPWGVVNGNLAGYEKLVLARGTLPTPPYGEGWGALMGWVPGWPQSVFGVDLLLACLAPPLLAALVRRSAGARAGLAAGLFLALLPVHIGVSASETMHVSVTTLELLAVLAADRFARAGTVLDACLAALATGLAIHIRPDVLPFVLVPLGWVAVRRAPGVSLLRGTLAGGALLAGLVVWRLRTMGTVPGSSGLLQLPGLDVLLPRIGAPVAAASFQLFWHAGFTPAMLGGLALLGLAVLVRARRWRELAAWTTWAALATLPLSAKVWPLVDAIRLQLPGQAPWLALAAIGAAALPPWTLPLALLAILPSLRFPPWVQTQEWGFLRSAVPELPPGSTVRYDDRPQRAASFAAVMEALGPARWSPDAGDFRYVGLDCLARGGCEVDGCTPWRTADLDGRVDLDLTLSSRTIGLYRCP